MLYRSDNCGDNWVSMYPKLNNTISYNVGSLAANTHMLVAATTIGLYSSEDEGENWHDVTPMPGVTDGKVIMSATHVFYQKGTDLWVRPIAELPTSVGASGSKKVAGNIYPNPTNENTVLPMTLQHAADVQVQITDATGRVVATLLNQLQPGTHYLQLPTAGMATGLYLVRINAGTQMETQKLTVHH